MVSPVVEGSTLDGLWTESDRTNPSTMEKLVRYSVTKRVMPDRSKITVTSEVEVKYWIKHLGVTREELERASSESAIPRQAFGRSYEISSLTLNDFPNFPANA
jgi:uncharacterized protein DUF3606